MTAPPKRLWKVRVLKCIETWEDVLAPTKEEAEAQALALMGVKAVLGTTVLGDKPFEGRHRPSVEDSAEEA